MESEKVQDNTLTKKDTKKNVYIFLFVVAISIVSYLLLTRGFDPDSELYSFASLLVKSMYVLCNLGFFVALFKD